MLGSRSCNSLQYIGSREFDAVRMVAAQGDCSQGGWAIF